VEIGSILDYAQYGISIEMNEDGIGYPIYRMNEISNMLCIDDLAKYADISSDEAAPFILKDRDILFNRTNSQMFVGRTGLFLHFSTEPRVFASYLIRLIPRGEIILPEYLVAYLNSSRGIRDIKRRARISINQSNVNAEEVKAVRLPCLSIGFQEQIKNLFDVAHERLIVSKRQKVNAEIQLLRALGLEGWQPPEPLSFTRRASEAFAAGRLDAEYFSPRVKELISHLSKDGLKVGNVAQLRKEQFDSSGSGDFDYIEISDLRNDGTTSSRCLPRAEAPSRATWQVHKGDVITSLVRPIRRLSAIITPDQDSFICSSGFAVLRPISVSSELLLTYLRLPLLCELMDLHTSASMYPAISERDLLNIPFRHVDSNYENNIAQCIQQSHDSLREANLHLERAKRAVEIAIEQDEVAALDYLKESVVEKS
jgi:restriction endonuclease S subunit